MIFTSVGAWQCQQLHILLVALLIWVAQPRKEGYTTEGGLVSRVLWMHTGSQQPLAVRDALLSARCSSWRRHNLMPAVQLPLVI